MEYGYDPYEALAAAIVYQAVRDFRRSARKLSGDRKNDLALRMRNECLRFFRSRHFGLLTEIDPEALIDKINAEISS